MTDFTPEACIARLRDWALAKSTPSSAVPLSYGSNVLLGAAMHGMARRSNGGAQLTEIEEMAVQFFDVMTDNDEERASIGQICSEAKHLARSGKFMAANIPQSVMTLSEDEPYSKEKFATDFKALAEETIAQAHIRIVGPEQISPDGTVETTEDFDAACDEQKRGLTMFASPSDLDELAPDSTPPRVFIRIKPTQFLCIKKSKEVGKDEVYFTWGFGSDTQEKRSHRTPEFGSVKNGVVRDFPQNPPFFSGYTQKAIAGHVCWEADHSNSEWYRKLTLAMQEIADKSAYLTRVTGNREIDFLIGLIPGMSDVGTIAFWLENIASIVRHLLDMFRNKDDKVVEHSYGWNRNLAESLAKRGSSLTLDFNGGKGGHHKQGRGTVCQELDALRAC